MTLKEIKTWLNDLPEDFDNYELVNGEIGILGEDYHYRADKPIIACTIDEATNEIIFMHQAPEELTENDIKKDDVDG